jgi:NitT/TauT family transport system substrate-binding protein
MGGVKLLSATDSFIPGAEGKQKLLGVHSVLLANQTFLKDNPETTRAIIRALQKASKIINESADSAAENVSKTLNVDVNDVKTMMKLNRYSLSITPELIDDIKANGEFLKSKGTIKDIPDFSTFVNPNFLKGIDPSLVTWKP